MKNLPKKEQLENLIKSNSVLMEKAVYWREQYTNLAWWNCVLISVIIYLLLIIIF